MDLYSKRRDEVNVEETAQKLLDFMNEQGWDAPTALATMGMVITGIFVDTGDVIPPLESVRDFTRVLKAAVKLGKAEIH